MDLGLRDRTYIVTGASAGLGFATAKALAAEGARLVISSRNEESIARAAAELGENVVGIPVDNAAPDSAERLAATAIAKWGALHGALISVGGPRAGTALDTDEEDWRAAFDSVFLGGLRIARAVARAGAEDTSIAFVLSSSVKSPINGLAISNGLRPGLAMVAKTLADELGPQGVRVNLVSAGPLKTLAAKAIPGFEELESMWSDRSPLGWDEKDRKSTRQNSSDYRESRMPSSA